MSWCQCSRSITAVSSTPMIKTAWCLKSTNRLSHRRCCSDSDVRRRVVSRTGSFLMYLYSAHKEPAEPMYKASGTPPANESWIFQQKTSLERPRCIERMKLCSLMDTTRQRRTRNSPLPLCNLPWWSSLRNRLQGSSMIYQNCLIQKQP